MKMDAGATLSRNRETAVAIGDILFGALGVQTTSNGISVVQGQTTAPLFTNRRHLDLSTSIMILTALLLVALSRTVGIVDGARSGSSSASTCTGEKGVFQSSHDVFSYEQSWTAVSERLLRMCSFCDTRNEQGTVWCHCCGAKLEHSLAQGWC